MCRLSSSNEAGTVTCNGKPLGGGAQIFDPIIWRGVCELIGARIDPDDGSELAGELPSQLAAAAPDIDRDVPIRCDTREIR